MNDLELETLLRNARRVAPRPEIKERLRASVLSAAALGGALATGTAHAASATATSSSIVVIAAKTPLLTSALYALAAGAAIGGLVTAPLAMRAPTSASSSPISRQAAPRSSGPVKHQAPRRTLETNAEPAPSASSLSELTLRQPNPPPRAAPSSRIVPSIERETLLLFEAQRALQRGDAPGALGWLDRYGAEFPRGALAEEALAARGVAWCSLGRRDLGQRALHTFEQSYPSSPLLPRLKVACRNVEQP
jgi:hypothetical protein